MNEEKYFNQDDTLNNILSDAAIQGRSQDRLGRMIYAEKISHTISSFQNQQSITIGIYGGWGTGKTSLLNMIKESLSEKDEHDEHIIIDFNPWRYKNEEQILLNLFVSVIDRLLEGITSFADPRKSIGMASSRDQKTKRAQENLEQFIRIYAANNMITNYELRNNPNMASSSQNSVSYRELEIIKRDVETILLANKKRMLIIIDDVDRLGKDEIQGIFKCIKVIADFNYSTYLLTFDKESVERILEEVYHTTERGGERFIDKIIQLPLAMPALPLEKFDHYLKELLDELLEETNPKELLRWGKASKILFSNLTIVSPRKAKRFVNSIKSKWVLLDESVNLIDLLILEAMNEFYPDIYKKIKHQSSQLEAINVVYFDATKTELKDDEAQYIGLLLPIKNDMSTLEVKPIYLRKDKGFAQIEHHKLYFSY